MTQTKEQKADLKAAQQAAPSEEQLRDMATRVPPLVRDDEHSFVDVDDTDRETDPDLIQPDLTGEGVAALRMAEEEEGPMLKMTRPDPAKSTYERSSVLSEVDLERMTDEQIRDSKALTKASPQIHPARLAPSSDRPRQPGSTAPAAGAGSWPVHEGQMPAVMPTDPPLEDAEDRELDNGFAKAAGFSTAKDGTLKRKGLSIEKNEVSEAAALYLRLRQQFPAFTRDQLADEFEVQWLSGRAGAEQSHRAGEELSQHGLTEVGDDRVTQTNLGELRATSDRAFEADPEPGPAPDAGEAGAPTENEPASTAVDQAKESSGEAAAADEQAAKEFAKFDKDGDGKPGGAPPGGNKPK